MLAKEISVWRRQRETLTHCWEHLQPYFPNVNQKPKHTRLVFRSMNAYHIFEAETLEFKSLLVFYTRLETAVVLHARRKYNSTEQRMKKMCLLWQRPKNLSTLLQNCLPLWNTNQLAQSAGWLKSIEIIVDVLLILFYVLSGKDRKR